MNGREVTEIKLSEALVDNWDFRLDSELFRKEYVRQAELLRPLAARLKTFFDFW